MAARTANAVEHVRDDDFGAHVTQRIGPRVQGTDHGTYTMASFRQDGDGRIRGRADAAGGACHEDRVVCDRHGIAFLPSVISCLSAAINDAASQSSS